MWRERALAGVWRAATREHLQREACLEAALTAALEEPGVLQRIAERADWDLPPGSPTITTQDIVTDGRTDIRLQWDGYGLVLELKVGEPPSEDQVRRYLLDGVDVAAVARCTRRISSSAGKRRFLGVLTWRVIRDLDWDDAPLALRQLHHLIDAMEVAMPTISLSGMTGLSSSWHAWQTLRAWSQGASDDVVREFEKAGQHWVQRHSPRGPYSFEERNERYVAAMWPPPLRADFLKLLIGVFVGRSDDPTLIDGVPDLALFLHVDPHKQLGQRLHKDEGFCAAVEKWRARESGRTRREFWPGDWEILRARQSGLELLQATDQEAFFKDWVRACATEWVDDGVLARLGKLETETRPKVGAGTEAGTEGLQ